MFYLEKRDNVRGVPAGRLSRILEFGVLFYPYYRIFHPHLNYLLARRSEGCRALDRKRRMMMKLELPAVIAQYFSADKKGNAHAIAECFTDDAIVVDEGNTYKGREAIRQWMANASTQYTYTVEPFSLTEEGGRTIVTSHLVGNFPGSPVDLRYLFRLEGDKIAELEIVP
ncbi:MULTISPECIES: nuclear transport factor 2 family protein [Roseovarius]|uniref:nuclear transport factor 2 family protein n=1 Tax=Roseovarius TaxID=74030 RepID=UPI0021BD68A1|nr:nuclear transport factor 2 family protein [Roseovarius atlanticus]